MTDPGHFAYPNITTRSFNKPVIVVEGIIGAGKTTLTQILAEELNLRGYYEPVDNNPYLKKFYEEEARIRAGGKKPNKYAFAMQMELMYQRFAMHKAASWEVAQFNQYKGAIIDRSIFGDRVFAKLLTKYGNIEEIMWRTYENTFYILSNDFTPPQYMIFVDPPVEVAWRRAKGEGARNRDQESPLKNDDFYNYLVDLREEHLKLLEEIESGYHSWSKYIDVIKVEWTNGLDPNEFGPVVDNIRDRINLESTVTP